MRTFRLPQNGSFQEVTKLRGLGSIILSLICWSLRRSEQEAGPVLGRVPIALAVAPDLRVAAGAPKASMWRRRAEGVNKGLWFVVYTRLTHGLPVFYPWSTHGLPVVYPWFTRGLPCFTTTQGALCLWKTHLNGNEAAEYEGPGQ